MRREQLPTANALIEGATFVAIFWGRLLQELAAREGETATFAILVIGFAIACWISALLIPATGEGAPHLKIEANIAASTVTMMRHRSVPAAALRRAVRHGRTGRRGAAPRARHRRSSAVGVHEGSRQPVDRRVLTPWGWRRIGELEVGDFVVGSDGEPTPVLGVFPQGRREVFRVVTQDGASTLACAEHLWFVRTLDDARHGKAGRVLRTQDMVGNLRRAKQRRYELPLVSAPVQFGSQPVPMDPYAVGLLLGDGCMTTTTTPSFTTTDPELVEALAAAVPDVEPLAKGGIDYRLRPIGPRRGPVANPVTTILRETQLAGTNSATKFVPLEYLLNSPDVRLAVLQGLLDTDGGPVVQAKRSCRINYTTCSPQLRDDVVFLVRSLGGVAYSRTRPAAGRKPGFANGREVHHRNDAHTLDIRLPEGIQPFRLMRKAAKYRLYGAGRPMRFIDSIESAGKAETVCIQVAAQDSLYVTDDFLVTHNTLNSSFIILDEAQNTTPEQMKMFLTRIGFGSQAVVTGDTTQVDVPGGRSGLSGLERILTGIDGLAFVHLSSRDVVRHRIVQDIVDAYERVGGDPPSSSR